MNSPMLKTLWRPSWLRPLAILFSAGLHGYAVVALANAPERREEAPVEALEFSMAPPEGETLVEEEKTEDSVAREETVAGAKEPEPPPPPVPDAVEQAKVEEPEAEAIEATTKPVEEPPPEKPEEVRKEPEPVREIVPETTAQTQTVAAAEESFASRTAGVENGLKQGGGMTKAAYAAAVKKQIAKNRKRPSGQGQGTVSVNFIIGAAGRADRIAILRSVNPALDETARGIVAAIRLPPPPGGAFQGTIAFKFE